MSRHNRYMVITGHNLPPVTMVYVPAQTGLLWYKHILPSIKKAAKELGWEPIVAPNYERRTYIEGFPYVFAWMEQLEQNNPEVKHSFDVAWNRGTYDRVTIDLNGYTLIRKEK